MRVAAQGLTLALVLLVSACTSEWGCGSGAACPAQADVNGIRYGVSGSKDLPGVDDHLVVAADATNTSAAPYMEEATLYRVGTIDPSLILIGRANRGEDQGEYVVLFSVQRSHEAWTALCAYIAIDDPSAPGECDSAAPATHDP